MKGRKDWFDGIDELIHAAGCIASNNKSESGGMAYNIDEFFGGWRKDHVKKRMISLYGGKANIKTGDKK